MRSSKKQRVKTIKPSTLRLRARAKAAWHRRLEKKLKWDRQLSNQMFVLLDRVYAICGFQYDVHLFWDSWQLRANVDGLYFISTYGELRKSLAPDSIETFFGVRLWWQCGKCRRVKTSDVIYTDYDLGRQLEVFSPEASHRCRH